MPLRDPMRWARAEAVRLARLQQVRYCVLEDYRVVSLVMRPEDQEVRGVAYPQPEYRFVYCQLANGKKIPPIHKHQRSTVDLRTIPGWV